MASGPLGHSLAPLLLLVGPTTSLTDCLAMSGTSAVCCCGLIVLQSTLAHVLMMLQHLCCVSAAWEQAGGCKALHRSVFIDVDG